MGIPVGGTEGGTLGIEAIAALCNPHWNEAISYREAGREKLMHLTLHFRVRTLFHGLAPRLLSAVPCW